MTGTDENSTTALDQVIRLVKSAADHAVITGSFQTHSDEIRSALTEAFRCALMNGLIEIVPMDKWPEFVALDPPYRMDALFRQEGS